MPAYIVGYEVRGQIRYCIEAPTPEAAMAKAEALDWDEAYAKDLDIEGREVMLDGEPVEVDYDKVDELSATEEDE